MKMHLDDCPAGRDKYHLCICETLRMVRAAAKRYEEREKRDREKDRLNNARP